MFKGLVDLYGNESIVTVNMCCESDCYQPLLAMGLKHGITNYGNNFMIYLAGAS